MIRVDGLRVELGGAAVVDGVTFQVAPGQKGALRGESGAGKTTVLRALIGLHRPAAGRVEIAGVELRPENIGELRARLCYVPQSSAFFSEDLVREHVLHPFRFRANRHLSPRPGAIGAALERFRLRSEILDRRVADLSGGERQRLALVRALLLGRKVLLLDEVTAALDPENRQIVTAAVLGDEELTVLAVTHDDEWFERSAPRVTMAGGRVAAIDGEAR